MAILTQNTAYERAFLMVLSSDSKTGATGVTVQVEIKKTGSTGFALPAGSISEDGFGWYKLALTPADTDTLGDLEFHATSATCDATDWVDEVKTPDQVAAITGPATNYGSTLTRDELIAMAHKDIGVLEADQVLSASQLQDGVKKLNALIREFDASGKWLWAEKHSSLTLSANTWIYTVTTGFPSDMREPDRVVYRDAFGQDWPVEILTSEGYSAVNMKKQQGDTNKVYITNDRVLANKTIYIWPAPSVVNPTSVVTGTDAQTYQCIRSHTADSTNQPISGQNWQLYWSLGGSSPSAWVTGSAYTCPPVLLFYYRRPLYDFTLASDNPDLPTQWTRFLEYRLAEDLADVYGIALEERALIATKAKGAYESVFKSAKPQTTDHHNKAFYL